MNDTFQRAVQAFRQGDLKSAKAACDRLLRKQATSEPVLLLLATIQTQAGDAPRARQTLARALAVNPGSDAACYMLGNLSREVRDFAEASNWYSRAVAANPRLADGWINLGISQDALGRTEEALLSFDRALAENPGHPLAHFNRGNALQTLSRSTEAVEAYRAALHGWQGGAELRFNLGNALLEAGELEHAAMEYRSVLSAEALHRGAALNLAVTLRRSGKPGDASAVLDDVATWLCDDPEWLALRGKTAADLGHQADALRWLAQSAQLRPQSAERWFGFGAACLDCAHWRDAIGALQQATSLDPASVRYRSALLRAEMETWDLDAASSSWEWINRQDAASDAVHLDVVLANTDDPDTQRRFAASTAKALGVGWACQDSTARDVNARIISLERPRVAYLSPDFGEHPVGFSIVELLERHNRSRFETLGISLARRPASVTGDRIRAACDQFYDASHMGVADIGRLVRELGVSIAVDLAGFTVGSRPGVLAGRHAPIQVGYLGFAHTTGADWLDYLMADAVAIPVEWDHAHSEKIARLPRCFFPTDTRTPLTVAPPGGRQSEGLPADAVVLCCFNTPSRISRTIFDVWMRLLLRVPGAVLWLRTPNDDARKRMLERARWHGVAPARLIFARFVADRSEHLARHRLANLYLDTFPYNSHSTARDALQSGVPMVTIRGRAFASRVSASLLGHLGLDELVTENQSAYEDRAYELAASSLVRDRYAFRLCEAIRHSGVFDMGGLAQAIESAYLTMLARYRRGEPPRSFTLQPEEVMP